MFCTSIQIIDFISKLTEDDDSAGTSAIKDKLMGIVFLDSACEAKKNLMRLYKAAMLKPNLKEQQKQLICLGKYLQ